MRSDTFTKPTPAMLDAMFSAKVGDDVFEEDPTTILLEEKTATLFGYEAGLFCASGTMANQIAINVHVKPGDEVICDHLSHVYLYEGGGIAANSLASIHLLTGNRGRINAAQVETSIKPDNIHYPTTTLVSLENTVNKGGGAVYSFSEIAKIRDVCTRHQLKLHLDGARLWNALIETKENPLQYGACFDSISVCLSKGLGTPMGSVLLGNKEFIKQARRVRKRFGGGWRQSGYMAAAGIYALDHHRERLAEDHRRAREIGLLLKETGPVKEIMPVDTNIVIFTLQDSVPADHFVKKLAGNGVRCAPFGSHQVRMVTHLDFGDDHLAELQKQLRSI